MQDGGPTIQLHQTNARTRLSAHPLREELDEMPDPVPHVLAEALSQIYSNLRGIILHAIIFQNISVF